MTTFGKASGLDELHGNLKYRKIKGISRGGFGFVDLCENMETQELVAIKFIERGERVTMRTERQILNHHALNHPHVVHLIEVFVTSSYLAVVMEYVEGGTLLDHVNQTGKLDEEEARWYFQQMVIALDYLHKKEIASRDLKLQNILMCGEPYERPLIKLTGFGHAKHERFHSAPASLVGTTEYLSPEIIHCGGRRAYNARAADVWAVGVMLFRLVAGRYPFQHSDDFQDPQRLSKMTDRICNADYQIPPNVELSPEFQGLLRGLLDPVPERRFTVASIMQNPWFLEGLPPGVVDMNSKLPNGPPKEGQSVFSVREVMKEAQQSVQPAHTWDDSDFIEDHELHGMDPDDLDDFIESITRTPPIPA